MKSTILQHNIKLVFFALSAFIYTSCGMPDGGEQSLEQSRAEFSAHLEMGRQVAYSRFNQDPHGAAWLALVGDAPVVVLAGDDNSQTSGWETYDTSVMPEIKDDELIENAQSLIALRAESLGIKPGEMELVKEVPSLINPSLKMVSFVRSYQGYPVRDAYIDVIYANLLNKTNALSEVVNRSFGPITLANPDASQSPAAALADAIGSQDYTVLKERRVILPRDSGQKSYLFYLATEFTLRLSGDEGDYIVTLEDGSSRALEAYSSRISARSLLHAKVYERNYMDGNLDAALPLTKVTLNSAGQITDLDGGFDVTSTGSASVTLTSKRATVYDGSATVSLSFSAQDTPEQTIAVNAANMPAANAYVAIERVNAFVRRQLAASETPYLDTNLRINVNVSDSNCNAYYDSSKVAVNFYKEGGGCANTALVNDVVYHEWGHGLDDHVGKSSGISDSAFSEGMADVVSAYLIKTPDLGPGFNLNKSTPIRSTKNTKSYPADKGEEHAEGLIISGAFWDLRENLVANHGEIRGSYLAEKLFFQHLKTTDAYIDSYQAVLRLDDDDGNSATKSPNYCAITAAFANHGLAKAEPCQDPVESASIPLEADIFVGIASEDSSGTVIMASTAAPAASAVLCLKERAACASATAADLIDMTVEGTQNSRKFFVTKNKVPFEEQKILTILLKDAAGNALGGRTVKFISK